MQTLSYYAKAIAAGVYGGLIYLMSVIAPAAAHLSDITLLQWIGFAATVLGSSGLVAVITNGPKPVPVLKETYVPFQQTGTATPAADAQDAALKLAAPVSPEPAPAPAAPPAPTN